MKVRNVTPLVLFFVFGTGACDDKEEGNSIGAPQVEPPVTRNMPSGITTSSLALAQGVESIADDGSATSAAMVEQIKSYLYPTGEGPSPIRRLEKIDERMSSLNARAEDSARACLENGAGPWDVPSDLPGGLYYVQLVKGKTSQTKRIVRR